MKKILLFCVASIIFSVLLGCSSPQVDSAPKAAVEETRVIDPQNFTLVGFWKIEQRFLLDEEKSTEQQLEWIEVSVPREKYKEFKEWGESCPEKEFFDAIQESAGTSGGPPLEILPPISIIPSPAILLGFVPGGVCYFHTVDEIPGEDTIRSLEEVSLQGVVMFGEDTGMLIKEPTHSYNFIDNRLELITGYFEQEGDTQQKSMLTILTLSTPAAAEADGWPYATE